MDVTDPQLLTLALAIILPLSLLTYSNSRITEAKETLRAEMATGFMGVRAEFIQVRAILRMVADHDTRLRSFEERLH